MRAAKENIIPEFAQFSINVRTPDEDTRAAVLAAIRRHRSAEAAAGGAGAHHHRAEQLPPLRPSRLPIV